MIYAIENSKMSYLVSQGCWALSNLCRGKPMPRYEYIKDALPVLCKHIVQGQITDEDTLSDCIWGICHNINERINDILMKTGFYKKINVLLTINDPSIIVPVLRITGSLTRTQEYMS